MVQQNIAVSEKQDSFHPLRFPKSPYDLEGGVCFSGGYSHHQKHSVLAFCNRFDRAIDGYLLIVIRLFPEPSV